MFVDLIIVDALNDFCSREGALFVEGADTEAEQLAALIRRLGPSLSCIHAFCDEHHLNDIAHVTFWQRPDGTSPEPFTQISAASVASGHWRPRRADLADRVLSYVQELEQRGRNPLITWPPHCLFKSWGANIYPPVHDALLEWCRVTDRWVNYLDKGRHPFSEHFSGFAADVPDPEVPETQFRTELMPHLASADVVAWAGWAGSHCLKWTASDALDWFDQQGVGDAQVQKWVFFSDISAAVVSPDPEQTQLFAQWRQDFLDTMASRGASITTSHRFLNVQG